MPVHAVCIEVAVGCADTSFDKQTSVADALITSFSTFEPSLWSLASGVAQMLRMHFFDEFASTTHRTGKKNDKSERRTVG
eukprot:3413247-Pleurochrysis_carterae.AAC.1